MKILSEFREKMQHWEKHGDALDVQKILPNLQGNLVLMKFVKMFRKT